LNSFGKPKMTSEPLCDPYLPSGERLFPDRSLAKCKNNTWYTYNDSDTVFVFVHGILSSSSPAWLHVDPIGTSRYWPELVRTDERFGDPSIFLGGYYTEVQSGIYDIRAAADDLFDVLSVPTSEGKKPVFSRRNIVFVAHSTGGIVVRHLLTRVWHIDWFRDKVIGLVLVASPSLGAKDADRLAIALNVSKNAMGSQLRSDNNAFLIELDKDFKNLISRQTIPFLTGTELIENHFLIKSLGFFKKTLVTLESAARYFDGGHIIGGTDHSSIAKPDGIEHPSHQRLVSFYLNEFQKQIGRLRQSHRNLLKVVLIDTYKKIYDRKTTPGEMNSHVIRRQLQGLPLDISIEPIHFGWKNEIDVAGRNPDLIVIHYSSLDPRSRAGRVREFLQTVMENSKSTQVIVYSRVTGAPSKYSSHVAELVAEKHRHRVHALPVSRPHSFSNPRTSGDLVALVEKVLKIRK
jgi:pimeloyl-ACP methyl ester carboxylesterase